MAAHHGKHQKPLVLFIHGVGGNTKSTWGDFSNLIRNDQVLNDRVDVAFFGYPTTIWRLPFDPIAVRIEDVALAIQSEIASRYKDYSEILLICHSMGCTVARTYLIETLRTNRPLKIKGVLFFAEPEIGSEFAKWADFFSIQHWQMRQLRKGSGLLEDVKINWDRFVSNGLFKICEVKGGQDSVLPRGKRPKNLFFLADKDHRTIVKPTAHDDGSYLIFRNFVIDTLDLTSHDRRTACLFDIYQPEFESYYVERREDFFVRTTLNMQNLWLFGRSGVGKTAALMRALSRTGSYRIVSLGHYAGSDVHQLYCAFYESILSDNETRLDVDQMDWPELINVIVDELGKIPTGTNAILIEEMPLSVPTDLRVFFAKFCQILTLAAHRSSNRRLTFAFSSIADPRVGFLGGGRIAEMLKVKEFFGWRKGYSQRLWDVIVENTELALNLAQKDQLLVAANGSPRFVKLFFRNYLNIAAFEAGRGKSFSQALETTRLEMMQ